MTDLNNHMVRLFYSIALHKLLYTRKYCQLARKWKSQAKVVFESLSAALSFTTSDNRGNKLKANCSQTFTF